MAEIAKMVAAKSRNLPKYVETKILYYVMLQNVKLTLADITNILLFIICHL